MRFFKTTQASIVLLAILHSHFAIAATKSEADPVQKQIAEMVTQVAEENDIPALAVGTIRNGELFYLHATGNLLRDSATPVDQHTLFQIASLSKLFTGIIANQLIDLGVLDPLETVSYYLDRESVTPIDKKLAKVTVGMLLQHHSGITDDVCSLYRSRKEGQAWTQGYSRDELLNDIQNLPDSPLSSGSFQYSSCGYAILALVCEVASGKTYEALLEELVVNRFGLLNTMVSPGNQSTRPVAIPYSKTDRSKSVVPSTMGIASGASAIYSSVSDLVKLQSDQLAAYKSPESSPINKSLLLTEKTATGPQDNIRYGYGLMQIEHPIGRLYGHDGDADGYASFYVFSPEHNLGVVLLTSSGGEWVFPLTFNLIGLIME